ncbi:MAG: efflux RND transporter periplasmic adaptor subunit [Gammaproteobacteria bacterium]|jgi:multidrug efflux system membrane fusion protein
MFFVKQKIKQYVKKYGNLSSWHKLIVGGCGLALTVFLFTHIVAFLVNFKFHTVPKFIVATDKVVQKNVNINVNASGTVQPLTTIIVKSQVDGIILNATFTEGQMVQQGQLLFEIDPCPLQALYNQAVANLSRDQAELENAKLQLQKSETLHVNKFVSDQDYQQAIANFNAATAVVQASMAALDAAGVQLRFTKIYSPITGVTGQILVNPGNLIKTAAGTGLVSINQINPINVLFSIPEEHLPELIKNINNLEKLTVMAHTEGRVCTEHLSRLTFVDNQVDSLNGMIALKAEFCNCNLAFWPGQFVNISITIKNLLDALVVPNRAVQVGQQGTYVYIAEPIKPNKKGIFAKVKKILVKTGPVLQDETAIIDGLQFGQIVVTEGHSHLVDNDIVEIYAY